MFDHWFRSEKNWLKNIENNIDPPGI